MSVLIAHTGTGVFVRQTVEALHEAGVLDRFASTLIDDRNAVWNRLLAGFSRAIGRDNPLTQRKPKPAIPDALVRSHPAREILRQLVSRVDRSGVSTDRLWEWMTLDFDRWTAGLIGPQTTAVYGYEFNALALFERAAALGLPRILELPCAEHEYVSDLQQREWQRAGGKRSSYATHTEQRREKRTQRRRAEFSLATCVIVNSQHTLNSYRDAGLRTDHFIVIPLGVDVPRAEAPISATPRPELRLVFAGALSVGKGGLVLIDALKRLSPEVALTIDAYGSNSLQSALDCSAEPRLRLYGPRPQAELFAAFSAADALLLPSLSDGWGMVVTEALAHGLPVLTTTAVGASMLVKDGVNGRTFAPGDCAALVDMLEWAANSRDELRAMRPAARASVQDHQWRDYRRELGVIVKGVLQRG